MRSVMLMILFAFVTQAQKSSHPAILTHLIKEADTIEALFRTYSAHENHLDYVHLSACWTSLGRLAREALGRSWLQKNVESLEPLVQHTARAAKAGDINARGLANIVYGAARSGREKQLATLFEVFRKAL